MGEQFETATLLIHYLDERGWDSTTVEELAQAAGISRATFFRVYGSKEDVVFADHSVVLQRLENFLEQTEHDVSSALREGLMLVFQYHLDDQERTLARHRLLKQSTQLRNRELLTSHHYERLFRRWLRMRLENHPSAEAVAVSLSGATVALHNKYLRQWLAKPSPGVLKEFSQQAKKLIHIFFSGYGLGGPGMHPSVRGAGPVTVVTMFGEGSDTEEVCDAVRRALNETKPALFPSTEGDTALRDAKSSKLT